VCVYIYNSLLFFLQFLFLSFDAFGVLSTLKRFGGIDDTTLFIASKTQQQHDNGCFVVSMVLVFEHQREE